MAEKRTKTKKRTRKKAYYIVENAQGEKFLLPYFAETFRVLMDDKDTIRDLLNSVLGLNRDHEIIDLEYEFEKPIDVFMPEDDPARLDVWVSTKDNRYFNVETATATSAAQPANDVAANRNATRADLPRAWRQPITSTEIERVAANGSAPRPDRQPGRKPIAGSLRNQRNVSAS